jgi:hypothetical protein
VQALREAEHSPPQSRQFAENLLRRMARPSR